MTPLLTAARLAAESLLDQSFSLGMQLFTGVPGRTRLRRMNQDAAALQEFLHQRGYLSEPRRYHLDPPRLDRVHLEASTAWAGTRRLSFAHVQFESRFAPHVGEPGRNRWLAHERNRTAHAYLLEHPGRPRPWLVCLHGFGMGSPTVNFSGFDAHHLHHRLGLNLAFPCLPFHGPRGDARFGGRELLAPDYLNLVHTFAQTVWDARRITGWLKARGAETVGLYGISLGAYSAGLLGSLEDGFDCIIAGLPAADFPRVARDNEPWIMQALASDLRVDWDVVRAITHVVSPLTFDVRVPREARFVFAGSADRVARPDQARALWRHWDEPRIHWFSGGHVAGMFDPTIRGFVEESLASSGLA